MSSIAFVEFLSAHRLAARDLRQASNADKLQAAALLAATRLGGPVGEMIKGLFSPTSVAIFAASLGIWKVAHVFGATFFVDVVFLALGWLAFAYFAQPALCAARVELVLYYQLSVNAKDPCDLEQAADHLARAVVILGAELVQLALLYKATGGVAQRLAERVRAVQRSGSWSAPTSDAAPPGADLAAPDPITLELMRKRGLTPDTRLYRWVEPKHLDLERQTIAGNPSSFGTVDDPYTMLQGGKSILRKSRDLGPSLNVTEVPFSSRSWRGPEMVQVSIRLGDVLEQGGRIYPDLGLIGMPGAKPLLVTLPQKAIPFRFEEVDWNTPKLPLPAASRQALQRAHEELLKRSTIKPSG